MNYKHLSQKERDEIYDLSQQGEIKANIARMLNRDPSTVGREIKRNESSIERRFNNSPKKKKHYLLQNQSKMKKTKFIQLMNTITGETYTMRSEITEEIMEILSKLKVSYSLEEVGILLSINYFG